MASQSINTYDSNTDLALGAIPDVEDAEALYEELLDIHNALEALLKGSDSGDAGFAAYIAKQRSVTDIDNTDSPYTVLITDGTIRVDATAGDVDVVLPPIADGPGYRYDVKRVDTVTTNSVTIDGDGSELIDARASGINLSTKSSYTMKANDVGYDII